MSCGVCSVPAYLTDKNYNRKQVNVWSPSCTVDGAHAKCRHIERTQLAQDNTFDHAFDMSVQGAALMSSAAGIMRRLEQRMCTEGAPCQFGQFASLLKALLDSAKRAGTSRSPPATAPVASAQPAQPSRSVFILMLLSAWASNI